MIREGGGGCSNARDLIITKRQTGDHQRGLMGKSKRRGDSRVMINKDDDNDKMIISGWCWGDHQRGTIIRGVCDEKEVIRAIQGWAPPSSGSHSCTDTLSIIYLPQCRPQYLNSPKYISSLPSLLDETSFLLHCSTKGGGDQVSYQ